MLLFNLAQGLRKKFDYYLKMCPFWKIAKSGQSLHPTEEGDESEEEVLNCRTIPYQPTQPTATRDFSNRHPTAPPPPTP